MKKNILFAALILLVGALLFLLRATGMTAHIALSVVGLALLVAYTVTTKKTWQVPVLEILMRVFYAIALISGAVMMNVHGVMLISVVHKACAALFVLALIIVELPKACSKNK